MVKIKTDETIWNNLCVFLFLPFYHCWLGGCKGKHLDELVLPTSDHLFGAIFHFYLCNLLLLWTTWNTNGCPMSSPAIKKVRSDVMLCSLLPYNWLNSNSNESWTRCTTALTQEERKILVKRHTRWHGSEQNFKFVQISWPLFGTYSILRFVLTF